MVKAFSVRLSPLRLTIAVVVGLVLIAVNGLFLIAERVPSSQAERSMAIAPWRGAGYSDRALELLADPQAEVDMDQVQKLALHALKTGPLDTGAYFAMARALVASGETRQGNALIDAAASISRRDPNVQMYLTRRAAQRNDLAGVMKHLNIVLRSSRSGREVAFPILCGALTDDRSIQIVASDMAGNANWVEPFIEQCSSSAATVGNLAQTLIEVPQIARSVQDRVHVNILANLIDQKKFGLAAQYYSVVTRRAAGASPSADRFERFETLPHFDWVPATDGAIYIDRLSKKGGLAVSTETSAIPLMERLLVLPPGRYSLTSMVSAIDLPTRTSLFWTIQCQNRDERLGTLDLRSQGKPLAIGFTVPAEGCSAQHVRLRATGAGQGREITAEIPYIRIAQAQRGRGAGRDDD